ncbi:hypothetical protein CATRI_00745 [Corynebacterium atrinae]|nr:hypothetical protein [Corynebacterium atrinae]WJY62271.1 hypothetical protein CATRI_00745 [Corynebacterium atrinae]
MFIVDLFKATADALRGGFDVAAGSARGTFSVVGDYVQDLVGIATSSY